MTSNTDHGSALPTEDAKALAEYMSDMSEEAYSAGWMMELEYALWHAVMNGPREYGRLLITEKHIQDLRSLSNHCKGWIIWDTSKEEKWIPMAQWEKIYTKHRHS